MASISRDYSHIIQYLENPGPYKPPKKAQLYNVLKTKDLFLEVCKFLQPLEDLSKMARTSKLFRDAVPLARARFMIEFHRVAHGRLLPTIFKSIPLPAMSVEQNLGAWLDFFDSLNDKQLQPYQEVVKKNFPKVEKIYSRNPYVDGRNDFKRMLCLLRLFSKLSISAITLTRGHFTDVMVKKILDYRPQITELHFSGGVRDSSPSKAALLHCLPQFKRLQGLTAWSEEIDDEVLIALASSGNLTKVDLIFAKIRDRGVSELVQRNPGLTHLCLSENDNDEDERITETGLKAIGDSAKNLVHLKFSFSGDTNFEKQTLKDLIASLPKLQEFIIFNTRHFEMEVDIFSEEEKEELQAQYPQITFSYSAYKVYEPKNPKIVTYFV